MTTRKIASAATKLLLAAAVTSIAFFAAYNTNLACAAGICKKVRVRPNVAPNCIAGGSYCASNEGKACGGWRKCTTVYLRGGTCDCRCQ